MREEDYAVNVGIKRPTAINPHGQNIDFLVKYGFEHLATAV
jgi:hypothetical protein